MKTLMTALRHVVLTFHSSEIQKRTAWHRGDTWWVLMKHDGIGHPKNTASYMVIMNLRITYLR